MCRLPGLRRAEPWPSIRPFQGRPEKPSPGLRLSSASPHALESGPKAPSSVWAETEQGTHGPEVPPKQLSGSPQVPRTAPSRGDAPS